MVSRVNSLHTTEAQIRVCLHDPTQTTDAHGESSLTGNVAKSCRFTGNKAKCWLPFIFFFFHPPNLILSPASNRTDSPSLIWISLEMYQQHGKQTIPPTSHPLFLYLFLSTLLAAEFAGRRFTRLIAVWAQINDTSEAPPDATEVQ